MYHIDNPNIESTAMIGSSNMTASGLGYAKNSNIELNLELNDRRDIADVLNWFEDIWNDNFLSRDAKKEVLDYLSKLHADTSPEFIYYLTLFKVFENTIKENDGFNLIEEKTGFFETKIWNSLYSFQKDGVKGAINKIQKHGGCIIADSVGLGKTFEALAVIKYFEITNRGRVLVLCPKRLGDNWMLWKNPDNRNTLIEDRFNYEVLYHSDLTRNSGNSNGVDLSSINWGNYSLVVIDESHNFKNNSEKILGKKNGEDPSFTRYGKLMQDVLLKGIDTKVLLLSATPVNTSLKDLRNQIYLITKKENSLLSLESEGIHNISTTLKNAQAQFANWAKNRLDKNIPVSELLNNLDSNFFKLLDEITIARSRKHISDNYNSSDIGSFPERLPAKSISPKLDLNDKFPSYDAMYEEMKKLNLSIYNPSRYVKKEWNNTYGIKKGLKKDKFDEQKTREFFLIHMMRMNLLKRLESSIDSYRITLSNINKTLKYTLDKIDKFLYNNNSIDDIEINIDKDYIDPDFLEESEKELISDMEIGGKLKFKLAHLNLAEWKQDILKDRDALRTLLNNANAISPEDDGKLFSLMKLIEDKVLTPINPKNKKVLIFTAFSDTAKYLYDNLNAWASVKLKLHIACVSGGMDSNKTSFNDPRFKHQTKFDSILANFSPKSKNRIKMNGMPQDNEIDILIATDCISEGQNLQDCDTVINYDIHWNPIKIIQRFGRVDRLKSENKYIQLINFWPTADLNKYIKLKERVETRMALTDLTATADDNLLLNNNSDLENILDNEDFTYRDKQLLKLKDEILDLEEMTDSITLSDFTLDEFRSDLISYIEKNRELLEKSPLGLYSIVNEPIKDNSKQLTIKEFDDPFYDIAKSGIIFCLKHIKNEKPKDKINPLHPYFLVYIREDGTVRFNFINSKNILLMFKNLCKGKGVDYNLCNLFDEKTKNGEDMSKYNDLLLKSLENIKSTFEKKNFNLISNNKDSKLELLKNKPTTATDTFELVSWLVISKSK